jgi:hypothetical protein
MRYDVEEVAKIGAPIRAVYRVLTDFGSGRAWLQPLRPGARYELLEGGVGQGTRVRVRVGVVGVGMVFELAVTEPHPGRLLRIVDVEGALVISCEVAELAPCLTRLRISINLDSHGGSPGRIRRLVTTSFLRGVLQEEMRLIRAAAGEARPEPVLASRGAASRRWRRPPSGPVLWLDQATRARLIEAP